MKNKEVEILKHSAQWNCRNLAAILSRFTECELKEIIGYISHHGTPHYCSNSLRENADNFFFVTKELQNKIIEVEKSLKKLIQSS